MMRILEWVYATAIVYFLAALMLMALSNMPPLFPR